VFACSALAPRSPSSRAKTRDPSSRVGCKPPAIPAVWILASARRTAEGGDAAYLLSEEPPCRGSKVARCPPRPGRSSPRRRPGPINTGQAKFGPTFWSKPVGLDPGLRRDDGGGWPPWGGSLLSRKANGCSGQPTGGTVKKSKRKGRRCRRPLGAFEGQPVARLPDLLAILLNPRRPQPGKAVLVDRLLPGDEFLDGQRITLTRLFKAEQAPPHRRDNFCLTADNPTFRVPRRQIGNRKRTTVRSDNIFDARTHLIGHSTLTHST